MKKRILVLTTTYPRWTGDTEPAFVHNLSAELARNYDVHVLVPHAKGACLHEFIDGVEVSRFRYLPFQWQSLCYDGGIVPKLKSNPLRLLEVPFLLLVMLIRGLQIIRKQKVDVVHAHWVIPQGLLAVWMAALSGKRVKVLVTSHGADLYALTHPWLTAIKRYVFRNASSATVVSYAMLNYCQQTLHLQSPPIVASMGVDCQFRFVSHVPFGQRCGLVFVGRLVEKKGVRYLLEAFALLLQQYPQEQLTIVGDGPEKAELHLLASRLQLQNNVQFVGAVNADRVVEYFNRAKIAVMPSIVAGNGDQEGLGLVAAEALACGCVTIVSDIPAIQDVHDEPLLQFVSANAQSLYQTLSYVKADEERALSLTKPLRERVLTVYDWRAVGGRYTALIEQCGNL